MTTNPEPGELTPYQRGRLRAMRDHNPDLTVETQEILTRSIGDDKPTHPSGTYPILDGDNGEDERYPIQEA